MAFTHRFYRTLRIGTGTRPDPFRTSFLNFVAPIDPGTTHVWINDVRPLFYIIAFFDSIIHTAAVADPGITPLSPELIDQAAVDVHMGGLFTQRIGVAERNQITADQIPLRWTVAGTSARDFWHYLARYHFALNELFGARTDKAVELFKSDLTKRFDAFLLDEQTAITAWRGRHGKGRPQPADDVEDIIHDVLLTKPIGRSGPIII